jgi:hypothetical protein
MLREQFDNIEWEKNRLPIQDQEDHSLNFSYYLKEQFMANVRSGNERIIVRWDPLFNLKEGLMQTGKDERTVRKFQTLCRKSFEQKEIFVGTYGNKL